MFGYITVNQQELKIKEYNRYRAYYCGLCKSLRERHGMAGQMTLTYDMTFLAILLSGLYEPDSCSGLERCLVHPCRKHMILSNEYTAYAADMNILLAYHKCMDDWLDDKSLWKLSYARLLKKRYKTLEARYPRQVQAINIYMENVHNGEKCRLEDLDLISGYTGVLLGELFTCREDEWSAILRQMGFFLGKFIYLMDAYEDLEADIKKELYNPWIFYRNQTDFEKFCLETLHMMAAECAREFEKLPILMDAEILRNILYSGLWSKYEMIQKNYKEEKEEK